MSTAFEPIGVAFHDAARGVDMKLVTEGAWAGWLVWRHPDGQWASLRHATDDDVRAISEAYSAAGRLAQVIYPYGMRKPCRVADVGGTSADAFVLVECDEDPGQAHLLIFKPDGPLPERGDAGEIVFLEGGPTRGYWKFQPTPKEGRDATQPL